MRRGARVCVAAVRRKSGGWKSDGRKSAGSGQGWQTPAAAVDSYGPSVRGVKRARAEKVAEERPCRGGESAPPVVLSRKRSDCTRAIRTFVHPDDDDDDDSDSDSLPFPFYSFIYLFIYLFVYLFGTVRGAHNSICPKYIRHDDPPTIHSDIKLVLESREFRDCWRGGRGTRISVCLFFPHSLQRAYLFTRFLNAVFAIQLLYFISIQKQPRIITLICGITRGQEENRSSR